MNRDAEDSPLTDSQLQVLQAGLRGLQAPIERLQAISIEVASLNGQMELHGDTMTRVLSILLEGNGVTPPVMQRLVLIEQKLSSDKDTIESLSAQLIALERSLRKLQNQMSTSHLISTTKRQEHNRRVQAVSALVLSLTSGIVGVFAAWWLDKYKEKEKDRPEAREEKVLPEKSRKEKDAPRRESKETKE
jgi:uncharacterized coiled-coil protein SlyX